MIGWSRPAPWLAAMLLIASPAVGGQLLPLVHPCAATTTTTGHDHHAAPGESQGESPDDPQCTCIDSGQLPGLTDLPQAITVVVAVVGHHAATDPAPAADPISHAGRPIDLLPPPTAPPLA